MQKEIKGKRKISTARPKKKTTSQTLIKKRLPEKRTNVNNNKVDQSKIKKRIKAKPTKQDIRMRLIALGVLLAAIAVIYIVLGIEFAAIFAVGSAIIIGLGLLIRKGRTSKKRRRIINIILL